MPDNAIFYYVAYCAMSALIVGYTLSILIRRNTVARKRAAAEKHQ
jgi:hypothetical protein